MGALTKKEIAQTISEQMGFSVRMSLQMVDALFQIMKQSLLEGEDIKIVRFGTLMHVKKPARRGMSPSNGEPITIPSRRTVVFRPSKVLKGVVNANQGEKILQNRGSE